MDAHDESVLSHLREVAANGHVGDAQGVGDHLDRHRLALLEQVENHLLTLGFHGASGMC